jgi:HEAT repeat protein
LGDKQVVAPVLAKLDDPDAKVRLAVIEALGRLGGKQAVASLLAKLDDQSVGNQATIAAALHALGEPKGAAVLKLLLASKDSKQRQIAVRSYARQRDTLDQRLLSRDLDAADPWLHPQEPITEDRVAKASSRLDLTPDQVQARYEAMAVDLKLRLTWKQ